MSKGICGVLSYSQDISNLGFVYNIFLKSKYESDHESKRYNTQCTIMRFIWHISGKFFRFYIVLFVHNDVNLLLFHFKMEVKLSLNLYYVFRFNKVY